MRQKSEYTYYQLLIKIDSWNDSENKGISFDSKNRSHGGSDEIKLSHIHGIMHASLKRKPTFFRIFSKFWHLGVCRTPETQSLVNRNKRIKRDASK